MRFKKELLLSQLKHRRVIEGNPPHANPDAVERLPVGDHPAAAFVLIEPRVFRTQERIAGDADLASRAAADLLVLPYRRGSQSAVAPMALAQGVPVLSTAVGGVPEIVRDGVNGVIVPPGDPVAITGALEALSIEKLELLAAGAKQPAADLSWSVYAAALVVLLDRVF